MRKENCLENHFIDIKNKIIIIINRNLEITITNLEMIKYFIIASQLIELIVTSAINIRTTAGWKQDFSDSLSISHGSIKI